MKYLVLSATIMGLVILSPVANADGRFRGGYDRHYNYGFYGRDRFRNNGFYRNRYPARFGNSYRPYRNGGSYWNFSFGRSYRRGHVDGGALLGGILLGSVLGHSVASSRYGYERPAVSNSSTVRVIRRSPIVNRSQAPATRLLRDLAGRCYEITSDSAGNEARVELDPSVCNF